MKRKLLAEIYVDNISRGVVELRVVDYSASGVKSQTLRLMVADSIELSVNEEQAKPF